MKHLFKNKLFLFGALVIVILSIIALLAPLFTVYDLSQISIKEALEPPSLRHFFGTDMLGRDVFTRMVFATRIALLIGLIAVGISTTIGLVLGSIAGYFGGKIDAMIMRFTDLMLCFPSFFLILTVIAFVGPNIYNIMIIIGITGWMGIARLIRAEILSLKEREFIIAAKALGASPAYIIFKHLIPNGLGPVLVSFVFGVAGAILTESGLSFLGLGVQPPNPSWGNILMESKSVLGVANWLIIFPGLAILVTVLAFNLVGEGIRDVLMPKISKK